MNGRVGAGAGREWKPGDVAMVRNEHGVWNVAINVVGLGWQYGVSQSTAGDDAEAHPLLVLDPENRDQAERLLEALGIAGLGGRFISDHVQRGLRNMVTPPKPEEPGTWGVVEASCPHSTTRQNWVHHPDDNWWPAWDYGMQPERTPLPDCWDDLVDPVVVREGVQP